MGGVAGSTTRFEAKLPPWWLEIILLVASDGGCVRRGFDRRRLRGNISTEGANDGPPSVGLCACAYLSALLVECSRQNDS